MGDNDKENGAKKTESKEVTQFKEAGERYLTTAEEMLRLKEYNQVGTPYFKAMAAYLRAACLKLDVALSDKDAYFRAVEELTSQVSADWVERALCEMIVLQQNDKKDLLTHGQVRRFAQNARRVVRWLKNL